MRTYISMQSRPARRPDPQTPKMRAEHLCFVAVRTAGGVSRHGAMPSLPMHARPADGSSTARAATPLPLALRTPTRQARSSPPR
jgi:hypothetical protein